ncbi:MAG: C39 family peptidase [Arachnia sp.]
MNRIHNIKALLVSLVAGAMLIGFPAHAQADSTDDDTGTADQFGRDFTAPEERLEMTPEVQQHIADALVTLSFAPTLPESERRQIEAELTDLAQVAPEIAARARAEIRAGASSRGSSSTAAVPDIKFLFVTHQTQKNSYYCGPATASMIADYKGKNINQTTFAKDSYLKTDRFEATLWSENVMAPALNKALGTGHQYKAIQSPTLATLKGSFIQTIGQNYPLAIDTYEYAGDDHYNGHPRSRGIGHWIVGNGQVTDGGVLKFVDPASPTPFSGASKTFGEKATVFHKFVTTNGIVA